MNQSQFKKILQRYRYILQNKQKQIDKLKKELKQLKKEKEQRGGQGYNVFEHLESLGGESYMKELMNKEYISLVLDALKERIGKTPLETNKNGTFLPKQKEKLIDLVSITMYYDLEMPTVINNDFHNKVITELEKEFKAQVALLKKTNKKT
jgi:hypothetical protein